MSGHTESCDASRILCDALYPGLRSKIIDLRSSQSMRWCGLFESGSKRFAYINHRKTMARIEVWCLGELDVLAPNPTLQIEPRTQTSGGLGCNFKQDSLSTIC